MNTIARRGVRRLSDPSHALAGVRDPGERRSLLQLFREAKLRAQVEDIPIVTVPFEFAVEGDGSDPLAAPLFSAQAITPLHHVASGGLLTFNGRAFRGTLEITRDDEGDMIVVNQVDTAAYLASVVGSEEPTTWMPEALAAQAIAARTYLSRHLGKHDNYDLEGDTRDQEYGGIGGEADSTVEAVARCPTSARCRLLPTTSPRRRRRVTRAGSGRRSSRSPSSAATSVRAASTSAIPSGSS